MKSIICLLIILSFCISGHTQTITYNFDNLGRLEQVIYPDSSLVKYDYDAAGNRLSKRVMQSPVLKTCPYSNVTLFAGLNDNTKSYQWQIDTTGEFKNITNSSVFAGATAPMLTLIHVPSRWYNYKFRCLISSGQGFTFSPVTTIKLIAVWVGYSNTDWNNPANWSCGSVPDGNTDVIIGNGVAFYPTTGSDAACRSLLASSGSSVNIPASMKLTITGKAQ